jgi:TRAP-type mannitol/chloroaromatic compound transport system permease small subunit
MALTTLTVVILRYVFNTGSIIAQESIMYMHAVVFMLGIPYALKHDAHVRVDVFAERLGNRGRAWVDVLGHLLFLGPVCVTILVFSLPYVASSWRVLEGSSEVGGIPGLFLLKSLIPLTAALLLLQGLAEVVRLIPQLKAPLTDRTDQVAPD